MQVFTFLAAFLLSIRLKKILHPTPLYPKWRTRINYAWFIWVIYLIAQTTKNEGVVGLIGAAVLLGCIMYLNSDPDLSTFKFYITAHYPLIAITFIDSLVYLIDESFYESWQVYFVCATLFAFGWIFARWASSQKQRKELEMATRRNAVLDQLVAERTAELTKQKEELQETIKLLQATQAQLIQQEKLASLGELTAGIAHEIQNPLNFVNNFSEVSVELIDEMQEELTKGDTEEAGFIADDLKQNLQKIIHHGKRADSIVKGMLQHSRAGGDSKEPTDINKLADEYMRLSYHGLRAKDKSFNAELVIKLDENLPLTKVVAQDVGRVLLNLFTNAFYATHQKKLADPSYRPVVELTTVQQGNNIIITVKDNGTGIPDAIKDKIMQPFFTTKPTGEGTGLGLSLSYDIIVNAHGGKIDINSAEGQGAEFKISLPV